MALLWLFLILSLLLKVVRVVIMLTFFLVLHSIISVFLIVLVLLQKNEGGAQLLSGQNIKSLFVSSAGNFLTRLTIVVGFCFFTLSIIIGIISAHRVGRSLFNVDTVETFSIEEKNKPSSTPKAPLAQ